MTLGPRKFNHDSLMRFEQWPGGTPDPDGMGFVPFPNQPPPPPAVPPRIRHMNMIPTQNIDVGVDEERERRQAARRSCRQPQPGEGSSSSVPPPEPHSFDSITALMTQGFETLRLGQETLQLGQDSLLRRVSNMQQRQYYLAQYLHNLEMDL